MVFALLLLLAADPGFDESFRSGLLALQRNDLPAAQTSLETAAKLAPENGRVQVALAQTYRKLNLTAKADAAAAKAGVLGRQDAVVQQSLSIYYFEAVQPLLQKQKFAEVVSILTKARVESAQLKLALGVAYYGLRQFDEAATAFLATIAIDPEIEQPYVFLGKSLDQIPLRLAEVGRVFVAYQEAHPDRALGYLLHAKVTTDLDAAQKLLEKAIALNENEPSAHFELGAVFFRRQLFADAAREFERSAALDPGNATTHYRLANVYSRLGKTDAARAEREIHAKLMREQDTRSR